MDAVIRSLESLPRRLENAQKGNSWSQGLLALVEPAKRFVPDNASSEAEPPEGTRKDGAIRSMAVSQRSASTVLYLERKGRSQKRPTTMMWKWSKYQTDVVLGRARSQRAN